jgi:hypothetical protein
VEDIHKWRIATSGQYSAKSSYESLFLGATLFEPCERIWKSWVPPKYCMFLWLAAHKWCWTTDRLAKCGLPHPNKCPLCDQEEENIDNLLISCVFMRQFWYLMLSQIGLHSFAPQPTDLNFDCWWRRIDVATMGFNKKGLNSLVILGAWII